MKVVQINITCGVSSTGKICSGIARLLEERGHSGRVLYSLKYGVPDEEKYGKVYSSIIYTKLHALKSRIFGNYGFNAKGVTKKLIKLLESEKPDIVHLHNLHTHNCDLEMLFSYFKKKKQRLVWTFHDCWSFTGYCPHFTLAKCDKWISGCGDCPLKASYSWFADRSAELYERKKQSFSDLDMTIVAPSEWLAELARRTFFNQYDVRVINNGIDMRVFKPTESNFKEKHGISDKFTVLGVCFNWSYNKGIDVFVDLAEKLSSDYAIVLVGVDEKTRKTLPQRIISVNQTNSQKQLAEIYTACDVLLNPTREEVLGLVNIESLACGTPVVTFETGGSPETIDETCGMVVQCDIDSAIKALEHIKNERPFSEEACVNRALQFDDRSRFLEYIDLYLENEK